MPELVLIAPLPGDGLVARVHAKALVMFSAVVYVLTGALAGCCIANGLTSLILSHFKGTPGTQCSAHAFNLEEINIK